MIEPAKKYRRFYPGNEVRLKGAYYATCTSYETDDDGNVTCIHVEYDPESKGGETPDGRKVKGTIHERSVNVATLLLDRGLPLC